MENIKTDQTFSANTRKLDAITWALFFIWLGSAMLAGLSWGWFFLGVGVLILAVQLVRTQMSMKIEGFWVLCGVVFLVGGLWSVLNFPWPIAPVLLILLGVALLVRVFSGAGR